MAMASGYRSGRPPSPRQDEFEVLLAVIQRSSAIVAITAVWLLYRTPLTGPNPAGSEEPT
jgi:hypothetical protein